MGLNKAKTEWVWCNESFRHLGWIGWAKYDPPMPDKRSKCPDCSQRFITAIKECHDAGCLHSYIPPHKKRVKV